MIPGLIGLFLKSGTFGNLSATAAPSFSYTSGFTGAQFSAPITATASGGTAPYTYLWTFVDGDSVIGITTPAAATTSFSKTMSAGDATSGTFKCTVTDSAANSVDTNLVTIQFEVTN